MTRKTKISDDAAADAGAEGNLVVDGTIPARDLELPAAGGVYERQPDGSIINTATDEGVNDEK